MAHSNSGQEVEVWDWSIRVFHWCLPILIFLMWLTNDQGEMERHFLVGQVLLGLLTYRLIWGVIGTPYARFKHFLYGPKAFFAYAKGFFSGDKPRYLSHNPMGGVMVFVLLGAVIFQLVSGLFTTDDIFTEGPLYDTVSRDVSGWFSVWHSRSFDFLLVLIALHLLAITVYKLRGEGLVKAMFTGKKKASLNDKDFISVEVSGNSLGGFPWWRFVLAVGLSVALVVWIFYFV